MDPKNEIYSDVLVRMVGVAQRLASLPKPPECGAISDLLSHLAAAQLVYPEIPGEVAEALNDAAAQEEAALLPLMVAIYEHIKVTRGGDADCELGELLQLIDKAGVIPAELYPIYQGVLVAPDNTEYISDLEQLFQDARRVLKGIATC